MAEFTTVYFDRDSVLAVLHGGEKLIEFHLAGTSVAVSDWARATAERCRDEVDAMANLAPPPDWRMSQSDNRKWAVYYKDLYVAGGYESAEAARTGIANYAGS